MYSLGPLALAFAACLVGVRSTSSFSQPPGSGPAGNYRDNPEYDVGEKIDVQWTSDLERMDLWLWQEYPAAAEGSYYYYKLLSEWRPPNSDFLFFPSFK
jgi:hypothetical protein